MSEKKHLSVQNDIIALALINIRDVFQITLAASDKEIEERYGGEREAVGLAEKYLDIAMRASVLAYPVQGWEMGYSQPTKDGERIKETAYFFDVNGEDDENGESDKGATE